MSIQLSTRPETSPAFNLRLYPISLERSALLSSIEFQERHTRQTIQTAFDVERSKVESEWNTGRENIRKRMFEGIEERRKRAREEKDGEGTVMGESAASASLLPPASQPPRAVWILPLVDTGPNYRPRRWRR